MFWMSGAEALHFHHCRKGNLQLLGAVPSPQDRADVSRVRAGNNTKVLLQKSLSPATGEGNEAGEAEGGVGQEGWAGAAGLFAHWSPKAVGYF